MKIYLAMVEPGDAQHAHGVWFPDLPGVYSGADDANDIIPHAIEALQLWAEDEAMPAPSDVSRIVAREDVRADLANGHYLISVPFIENDATTVRANTTFERGLLRAIDETAKARGLTRSAFLADVARREIEGAR